MNWDAVPRQRMGILDSVRVLRTFGSVTSFRAPYLRFPDRYLPMLEGAGFLLFAIFLFRI